MRRVNRSSFALALAFAFTGGMPVAQPVDAASVNSLALKATYEVTANFSWATRAVSVHTTAEVYNPTGGSISKIAFNLGTLRTGNANVGLVTVRGFNVTETIQDQTVLVPVSPALGPVPPPPWSSTTTRRSPPRRAVTSGSSCAGAAS